MQELPCFFFCLSRLLDLVPLHRLFRPLALNHRIPLSHFRVYFRAGAPSELVELFPLGALFWCWTGEFPRTPAQNCPPATSWAYPDWQQSSFAYWHDHYPPTCTPLTPLPPCLQFPPFSLWSPLCLSFPSSPSYCPLFPLCLLYCPLCPLSHP